MHSAAVSPFTAALLAGGLFWVWTGGVFLTGAGAGLALAEMLARKRTSRYAPELAVTAALDAADMPTGPIGHADTQPMGTYPVPAARYAQASAKPGR